MTIHDDATDGAPGDVSGRRVATESEVVLRLSDSCLTLATVPVLEGSTEVLRGQKVAWVGDWSAVFELGLGRAEVRSGSVAAVELELRAAMRSGRVAIAPSTLALAASWTAREYLESACRVWRLPASRVQEALTELGVPGLATRKLTTLARAEVRVLSLLQAVLTRPDVVLVEAPFAELDDVGQRVVARALSRCAEKRAVVATFPVALGGEPSSSVSAAGEYFASCDAVTYVAGGRILPTDDARSGGPSVRRYRVTVLGNGASFDAEVEAAGASIERSQLSGIVADRNDASTWLVALGPGATASVVLDAAATAGVTLVELLPLAPQLEARTS